MKTAVEWLIQEWPVLEAQLPPWLIEQAKEMEKQQIIDFADKYGTYLLQGGTMSAGTYNETYKK